MSLSQGSAAVPLPKTPRRGWLVGRALPQRLRRGQFTLVAVTLLVATTGFLLCQFVRNYLAARQAAVTLAGLAGETARPVFANAAVGTDLLAPVLAQKEVAGIGLYQADGRLLSKARGVLPEQISPEGALGASYGMSQLTVTNEVRDAHGRIGMLVLQYDLKAFRKNAEFDALLGAGVLGLGLLVAWWVGRRLRPAIVQPYQELCTVVDTMPTDALGEFTAAPQDSPAANRLVNGLKDLFGQLKSRDEDLQQTRDELEAAVRAKDKMLHEQAEAKQLSVSAAHESETRYRQLFENNPMPMYVMDLESLQFVAVNYAALKHYGYTEDQFLRLSLPVLTYKKDPLEVIRAFRSEAKSFDAGEWQHVRRTADSSEVIDMQLTAHAIVFGGKVAKIVLANDVTERNRAQRQLQDMHQQLVAASRRAGMAEVATDVLHNVGNVLNSVNVSAAMLVTGVRASKVSAMQKVSDIFAANRENLGAFLGEKGKGKKMPDYLATLAQQLETERAGYLTELELLVRNIEHIKQVVAFQQNHAKVASMREVQSARALIEEALRLTAGDFTNEGIETTIECPPRGCEVHTDHHKVLQILINLMTNACQAMMAIPIAERQLHIRIAPSGDTLVSIAIQDSGCGIKQECLTSIFNHGFTTKKSGHGFGLHGSANAAKELGGALSAASEGPGRGATFTLELPVAPAVQRETTSQAA